ncbi:MAG: hypothetical protein ACXVCX_16365 [Ktedonobacterales bacterium]
MADLPPYTQPGAASGWNNALSGVLPTDNLSRAMAAMNLTPEEQALYLRHLANLYGSGGVDNADGSRSSLYQVGFTADDGRQYNVPSVYDGQILSPDNAIARAMQSGLSQFPSYASPFQAENRYQQMHNYMDADTGAYMKGRR